MPSPGSLNASDSAHKRAHPESPRRSRCASPRKTSPVGRLPNIHNAASNLVASFDYEADCGDIWDSIPERDWRLLAALTRKREEDNERERLAEQFQKMWLKEKEEREMVEAETTEQYKKYLHRKRRQERNFHEYKRLLLSAEQQAKTGELINCIRHKEQKTADLLAWRDDKKITEIIGKAVEEEARSQLAAERRLRRRVAEDWRKQIELVHALQRADEAGKRRNAMLRDASQRLAITNALTSWETSVIRREVEAMEAAKRARFAAHNAMKDARSVRISKIKDTRTLRARRLAAITAQMREAVRMGR
ncbi:A-kinase anchor protein 17A isoform X1 [Maniola hyperantus]|uniref:A-kinase anchor protein 17A isoform X1 n=1 Tax=Aphantopus hyperantus TaxID=2795564 RepID=UPI00156A461E|nr:trichohyalin-like isoform X1 [Maniola hyperantus]